MTREKRGAPLSWARTKPWWRKSLITSGVRLEPRVYFSWQSGEKSCWITVFDDLTRACVCVFACVSLCRYFKIYLKILFKNIYKNYATFLCSQETGCYFFLLLYFVPFFRATPMLDLYLKWAHYFSLYCATRKALMQNEKRNKLYRHLTRFTGCAFFDISKHFTLIKRKTDET